MQKRFCSCGGMVWVRYLFANARWLAFFFSSAECRHPMKTCPYCGLPLDIQTLG